MVRDGYINLCYNGNTTECYFIDDTDLAFSTKLKQGDSCVDILTKQKLLLHAENGNWYFEQENEEIQGRKVKYNVEVSDKDRE